MKIMNLEYIKTYTFYNTAWGMTFKSRGRKQWRVTHVFSGTEAHQHGVERGWRIIAINNVQITEDNHQEMMDLIKNHKVLHITFDISSTVVIYKF
jgi:predicted metalloprotease with PDZ domain